MVIFIVTNKIHHLKQIHHGRCVFQNDALFTPRPSECFKVIYFYHVKLPSKKKQMFKYAVCIERRITACRVYTQVYNKLVSHIEANRWWKVLHS